MKQSASADRPLIDAIMMCGEGPSSHQVAGVGGKAFLPLEEGRPLFTYGLRALLEAPSVGRIFLVGPKERLDQALSAANISSQKQVITVAQADSLLSNAWRGFCVAAEIAEEGAEADEATRQKYVLYLSSDAPFITVAEIEEFVDGADMERYDYVLGLTPDQALHAFHPTDGKPGVIMAPFHAAEGLFRINNLHMARPYLFSNREAVQKMYDSRYQKSLWQAMVLLKRLLGVPLVRRKIGLYIWMQLASIARRIGFPGLSDFCRKRTSRDGVMNGVGAILGLRAGVAETSCGGAALDVDNDDDYETIRAMYKPWRDLIAAREGRGKDASHV